MLFLNMVCLTVALTLPSTGCLPDPGIHLVEERQQRLVQVPLGGGEAVGGSHDEADAEWILIRRPLWGHNDTPAGLSAALGLAALWAYFVFFSYY
jgi:hypothetical protein